MADVSFTIEAIDKASAALTGIRGAMFSLNQTMQAAQQVYNQVSRVVDQTIGAYVRYADEMDKIHRLTGIQLEDASRLVQAADDVFVSQESITSGMQFAIRQGYQPSIEWIKKMADTLMAMDDPAARANQAIKVFGRQAGPELLKFLELGSTGIQKYMDGIDENLVLTEESRAKTIEWKQALDDLNDSLTAIKMGVVDNLIRPLTAYIQLLTKTPAIIGHFASALLHLADRQMRGFDAEMKLLGEDAAEFSGTIMKMAGLIPSYMEEAKDATRDYEVALRELEEQTKRNQEISEGWMKIIDDTKPSFKGMFYSAMEAQLANDGLFDSMDAYTAASLQRELGLVTEAEFKAMVMAINLKAVLDALSGMNVTITVDMFGNIMQGLQGGANPAALAGYIGRGGQIMPGSPLYQGGGSKWVRAGTVSGPGSPTVYKNTETGAMSQNPPPEFAYGGYVSGRYAITGDSMSGRRTGYEELVDFQQKRVYSAPETQAMGAVPGYAMGSGAIDLSYQTIQDLANAVAQKMSGYV